MTTEYTTYGCPACGMQHRAGDGRFGEMCPDLKKALLRVNGYVPLDEKRVREIAREEIRNSDRSRCPHQAGHDLVMDTALLEREKQRARDDALEEAARIAHSWNPSHYYKAAQEIRALKSQPAVNPRDTVASMVSLAMESTPGARAQPAAQALHDDMEGKGPCGGKRCWKTPDGHWIHSSKSYGTCKEIPNKPEREFNVYVNPAAQASASCAYGMERTHQQVIDDLRKDRDEWSSRALKMQRQNEEFEKERDDLRAKLAAASERADEWNGQRIAAERKLAEAEKELDEIEEAWTEQHAAHKVCEAVAVILKRTGRLK